MALVNDGSAAKAAENVDRGPPAPIPPVADPVAVPVSAPAAPAHRGDAPSGPPAAGANLESLKLKLSFRFPPSLLQTAVEDTRFHAKTSRLSVINDLVSVFSTLRKVDLDRPITVVTIHENPSRSLKAYSATVTFKSADDKDKLQRLIVNASSAQASKIRCAGVELKAPVHGTVGPIPASWTTSKIASFRDLLLKCAKLPAATPLSMTRKPGTRAEAPCVAFSCTEACLQGILAARRKILDRGDDSLTVDEGVRISQLHWRVKRPLFGFCLRCSKSHGRGVDCPRGELLCARCGGRHLFARCKNKPSSRDKCAIPGCGGPRLWPACPNREPEVQTVAELEKVLRPASAQQPRAQAPATFPPASGAWAGSRRFQPLDPEAKEAQPGSVPAPVSLPPGIGATERLELKLDAMAADLAHVIGQNNRLHCLLDYVREVFCMSLLNADREELAVLVGEPLPTILNRLRARVKMPQHLSALPEHDYEWFIALPIKSWLSPPSAARAGPTPIPKKQPVAGDAKANNKDNPILVDEEPQPMAGVVESNPDQSPVQPQAGQAQPANSAQPQAVQSASDAQPQAMESASGAQPQAVQSASGAQPQAVQSASSAHATGA